MHVGFQNRLGFLPLLRILLAHPHDGAQRLDVETIAFALGIDVADIFGDSLLLLFQPLDALDDGFELVLRKACRGRFFFLEGGGGGHL